MGGVDWLDSGGHRLEGGGEGRMGGQGESSFTENSTKECGQGPSIRQRMFSQWVWKKGSPGLLVVVLSHFYPLVVI